MTMTSFRRFFPAIACLAGMAMLLFIAPTRANDAEIEKQLVEKGAKFKKTREVITGFEVADCSAWTEADFKNLGQLTHLQDLNFSSGLTDQGVAQLAGLVEVTVIQTNKAQVTDAGVKNFAQLKKLRVLKFFHPNKAFTGVGLAQLADMPSLQSLTVAGSEAFGDVGMAAVGKLPQLIELRSWHAGQSAAGWANLKELKNLKNINLGQRLTYKPPAGLSDGVVADLVEIKTLESIQLSESRMTLTALSKLKELPKLKTLTLDGIDIPAADIEKLKQELPKVQIKWTPPTEAYGKRIKALFGPG